MAQKQGQAFWTMGTGNPTPPYIHSEAPSEAHSSREVSHRTEIQK